MLRRALCFPRNELRGSLGRGAAAAAARGSATTSRVDRFATKWRAVNALQNGRFASIRSSRCISTSAQLLAAAAPPPSEGVAAVRTVAPGAAPPSTILGGYSVDPSSISSQQRVALEAPLELSPEGIAVVDYNLLFSGSVDHTDAIKHAYGFEGAGLLVVKNVPGFAELRKQLLPLGFQFANMDDSTKSKSELPSVNYSFGWSHGKEKLESGQFDAYKGSFYNNPQYDVPTTDAELIRKYPDSCHPNIWPEADLPQLRPAFKALGQLIVGVGEMVARECDKYVEAHIPSYEAGSLEKVIRESRTCKARLLYYFPLDAADKVERTHESWCGWHNDHGALTGLTSAMFINVSTGEMDVDSPEPESGLYAKSRTGETVQVKIPRDSIAFQLGESSQVLTGGILRATPHAVKALSPANSSTIGRSTFAVFMQPDNEVLMKVPEGVDPDSVAVGQFRPGQRFSDFHHATVTANYSMN